MIQVYDPCDCWHGLLLGQWWAQMYDSGDIKKMFPVRSQHVQALYKLFDTAILFMDVDDKGIWWAGWYNASLDGCFFGLWIRKGKRNIPSAYKNFVKVCEHIFETHPVIMGITIQEEHLCEHLRLGYEIACVLPKLFDGQDAWLVTLTKENFDGHRDSVSRRQRRRDQAERDAEQAVSELV